MKSTNGLIRLSATDLSNHLHCGHLTSANASAARGEKEPPPYEAPHLVVLQQRGLEHERAYLAHLDALRLQIVTLHDCTEAEALRRTREAMRAGVDVIVQAALEDGTWFGRPDVLRKVASASGLGDWSYEPYDCKLARETKGATILQLSHYAALLTAAQGREPESVYVVPPSAGLVAEQYRVLDYAAYLRAIQARLAQALEANSLTYPEPTAHCEVCRWWRDCNRQWRRDDHLSLTAGITRLQRKQLLEWETPTMELLGRLELPLRQRPRYGSRAGYERVREQARVQVAGRMQRSPVYEFLPLEAERGFHRLPEPSEGDIFFDLESDPFVGEHGLEYLFGYVTAGHYACRWAMNATEEKAAFEWFIDFAMERRRQFPALHIYHYGHKEPSTLKSLMGRYATREESIDQLLRGRVLVDLHSVTKQALRASVETYSLKALEEFHNFRREVPLEEAKTAMRQVEHALELHRIDHLSEGAMAQVQGYNADDCRSTAALRNWLEELRGRHQVARPALPVDAAPDKVQEQQERIARLIADLTQEADLPAEDQAAKHLLANLLDWHRREDKVAYWEKYRLAELDEEELLDERKAISSLRHKQRLSPSDKRKSAIDEYEFPSQETSLRPGDDLYHANVKAGSVDSIDPLHGLLSIRRARKAPELPPPSVYSYEIINSQVLADSLFRLGTAVRDHGLHGAGPYRSACDLLLRLAPRVTGGFTRAGEGTLAAAQRIALHLQDSVLAIQGPPGAGKTFTGARMIVELVKAGKQVGITAGSHKVIRKLLDEVQEAAGSFECRCLQKVSDKSEELPAWLSETTDNAEVSDALASRSCSVVAGTAWLWARADLASSVDVLFVDEAGQMSLANALAVAPAARSLVLLGDPQQLDQPLKGSHPDGAAVSALEHLLQGAKTLPPERGLFLGQTWRLHPDVCRFTSEAFYEDRLASRPGLERQRIEGHALSPAGLRFRPVRHEFNQNCSYEEVDAIVALVDSFLAPGVEWVDQWENRRRLRPEDILIVAPYNAQVAALAARLPSLAIGTVDKFQGQEAPIVIYSLTTSSPEDAPRGMEFLYSLNRLNVATSRAKALAILVASPRLLEPACQSPRQMQLANALCRYVELAEAPGRVRTAG